MASLDVLSARRVESWTTRWHTCAVGHVIGTPAQEQALSELVTPVGRKLHFRGFEREARDLESATIITAWVSTEDGAASGLFKIDPNGSVTGAFKAPQPPNWRSM